MNLQVNLLKKAEQRYQGIVSMKIMVLGSVGVLTGITVIVLFLAGISKITLNANLDRARREWNRLNPQVTALRQGQAATAANHKTLKELEGWAQGDRLSMYSLLRAVQNEIPAQMVLDNFYAGLEQASDTAPVYCLLRLSGRAQGELTAVEAKRKLSADTEVRSFCGEVKLVSSQRESGENWMFALEGRRLVGGAK